MTMREASTIHGPRGWGVARQIIQPANSHHEDRRTAAPDRAPAGREYVLAVGGESFGVLGDVDVLQRRPGAREEHLTRMWAHRRP